MMYHVLIRLKMKLLIVWHYIKEDGVVGSDTVLVRIRGEHKIIFILLPIGLDVTT